MSPSLHGKQEIIGTAAVTILTVAFNTCLFASVKLAALGTVSCLNRTAVMIVCMILGRAIMKEKITVPKVRETLADDEYKHAPKHIPQSTDIYGKSTGCPNYN